MFSFTDQVQAATWYINYSTGSDSNDGSIEHPWKTFTKGYASSTAGDVLDLTGTFTWSNGDETGDAGASSYAGFVISKELTIQGNGTDQTIFQSATTAAAASQRVFTVANGVSTTIKYATVRHGYYNSGSTYSGGACIYSGTTSVLTLDYLDINNCRLYGSYGGGVRALSTTTISNTSIHDNQYSHSAYGAGLSFSATGKSMTISNTTFYDNFGAWSASSYGSGIHLDAGSLFLTNSTVVSNGDWASTGGGIYVANSANAILYIQNSIVADNTSNNTTKDNIYKGTSGVITSGGYNIIGDSTSDAYFSATTGDWTDTNGDNTYVLYSIGTTGTLNLDTQAAFNDNAHLTYTYGLLSGSIAIDNATSTASNDAVIPTVDQRGGVRNGTLDIGAFEYEASGLTVIEPTTQASGLTFSGVDYKQLTVSSTIGNGQKRAVFIKQASTGTAEPVDGTSYTASTVFGSGSQIGSTGWYNVYNGYGSSVSITGLQQNTDYIVQIFEFNGVNSGTIDYLTNTSTANPSTQTTHDPVTYYIDYSSGSDSNNGLTTSTPWKTFTKAYASSLGGDILDFTGTFTWSNAAETGDAGASSYAGFVISKDLTIQGHGANQTIFQSAATAAAASQRIFTITNGVSTTIKNATVQNGYFNGGGTYYGGACIYSDTDSILTIDYLDINNCRLYASYGGGVRALSTTTISNTSIHDNQYSHSAYGAGVYFSATGKNMVITNSTFYKNFGGWMASSYGSGIYLNAGNLIITNSTIYNNGEWASSGGGIYVANSASAYLYLKNTIISGNTSGGSTKDNIYKGAAGTISSNGNNIVGDSTSDSYFTATTGDWTDTNGDNTYNLYSIGTTGTVGLDTTSTNSNIYYTYTYALVEGSIAIDTGSTSTNYGVSVPTKDQRGTNVSGGRDIGAYEYGGTPDITTYTLTYTSGAHGNVSGSSTQIIDEGENGTAVEAIPDAHYHFVNWSDSSTDNPRTDLSVTEDITVSANFSIDIHTLNYSAGANGTITGSSTQAVSYGSSGSAVTAVADEGYHFVNWSDSSTDNPRTDISTGVVSLIASFVSDPIPESEESSEEIIAPIGGSTFISPSSPKILITPKFNNGKLSVDVTNVKQMTMSLHPDFNGTSWQEYAPEILSNTQSTLYVKFRSKDGGESDVFILNGEEKKIKSEPTEETCVFVRNMNIGMQGVDVKLLQQYLNRQGFVLVNTGAGSPNNETEIFGQLTQTALKKFQIAKKLTVSGKLDDVTRGAMGCVAQQQERVKSTTPLTIVVQTGTFTRDLKLGMIGDDVRRLQRYLNSKGYSVAESGNPGSLNNETTYFGLATQSALIRFQEAQNIPAYGLFGFITRALIDT